ncbi:MAG: sigma-70 family RNA polymerase sigma factor [Rubrivivax sp.]|nr:sigma-70 family RNA polymerase sigma factor [Rubrivivax sp.]
MYDALEDAALVEQCRQGREAAWSTLVRRYQRLVYTVPRRAGLGEDAAADVFQATFARLFEHLHRIDDAARVRAWLVTTAKRETLRQLERQARVVDLAGAAAPGGADAEDGDFFDRLPAADPLPEALLADVQELDALRRAVERLEPRQRQLVELLFLHDEPLPYAQIAVRLGIAEGSIGPTRARVLARLRALMAGG